MKWIKTLLLDIGSQEPSGYKLPINIISEVSIEITSANKVAKYFCIGGPSDTNTPLIPPRHGLITSQLAVSVRILLLPLMS